MAVKPDLSDLTTKVRWLQEHDDVARSIGLNAAAFAREALSVESIDAYLEAVMRGAAEVAVDPPPEAPSDDDELVYRARAVRRYAQLNSTDHKGRLLDVSCPAKTADHSLLAVSSARTLVRQYYESADAALKAKTAKYRRPN